MRRSPHLRISARGLEPSGTSTHLTRQLSGTHYGLIRLLIRVHARRAASAFPSRPGTSPGTGETSQVPYKGLRHMHGVSDCARLLVAKPFRREDVAFSSSNWIGTSEFDPFRSSIPSL